MAKKKKDECTEPKKRGPDPMGLGTPFTLRLFLEQEAAVLKEMRKRGVSKGTVVREKLQLG